MFSLRPWHMSDLGWTLPLVGSDGAVAELHCKWRDGSPFAAFYQVGDSASPGLSARFMAALAIAKFVNENSEK